MNAAKGDYSARWKSRIHFVPCIGLAGSKATGSIGGALTSAEANHSSPSLSWTPLGIAPIHFPVILHKHCPPPTITGHGTWHLNADELANWCAAYKPNENQYFLRLDKDLEIFGAVVGAVSTLQTIVKGGYWLYNFYRKRGQEKKTRADLETGLGIPKRKSAEDMLSRAEHADGGKGLRRRFFNKTD
ncbi:hypothetical protein MYU51_017183 [Penicillium brevicompactum]